MYILQKKFIWLRKIIIRILFKQYPNFLLNSKSIKRNSKKQINFISSTNNFWVSKQMYQKWLSYSANKKINLYIYSDEHVDQFMKKYFKNDLIFEIYKKSMIPVQKIDIFRICSTYIFGGIWLDLKSEINLIKVINLYEKSNGKGILMYEPRKIEIVKYMQKKYKKEFENVIHNGFYYLPENSIFLKKIIHKIERDYLYFQDILFKFPKQGMMNLTGPHQFTRSFYELNKKDQPILVTHNDIDWNYCSKYGEFLSPFKISKHYSLLRNLKTIDSNKVKE